VLKTQICLTRPQCVKQNQDHEHAKALLLIKRKVHPYTDTEALCRPYGP